MPTTPKRKGQHIVRALIRVYSDEGVRRLQAMLAKPIHAQSSYVAQHVGAYHLMQIDWRPRPSHNEHNTESDWRREIAATMDGLYFDVLTVDYSWEPVT